RALFAWHGLRERRGVSFGNAAVLDAGDLIEYLGDDDRVEVLAAYLEGIGDRSEGDHARFTRELARVTARKPVVIWKGGSTHDGAYATETPAMLARDLDVLDRDPNVDFVAMDFFSMIMSAHRVQNDYGLGQRFRNDLPDAIGERFIDAIAAHARRASKPFFAI